MSENKDMVVRSSLKLKKGNIFKNKKNKVDLRQIDLTIKKEDEGPKKTASELAFEQRQRETAYNRLSKKCESHCEKVKRFNKQMEELTEFNDIPKVSWTK